ncbi:ATP-grasp fold amidoligase family protein [Butyrivibrio fibrisolvens]|uniref:ATP-grasp fold amidoligase family protein n=1 Tax=Butyrivibrio fibrisolvens TaxID=831 RepID=UPI0003FF1CD4|nr:ATP-grasp fold amidoligase family protein [Butyrivibrio fibrisolvens]
MVLRNIDYSYIRKNLRPFIRDKNFRFMSLHRMGAFDDMPDKEYLEKLWHAVMGYPLDLEHPVTFNEKIQWLKLYDRNPLYHTLVDKVAVKDWVADKIGEEYIIPTLGVWDDPDDIDFDTLPNQFVLKCNHNSGKGMCICKDKNQLDLDKVKSDLREGLKQNYFLPYREWAYKDVKPRIIAEKYISSGDDLEDYKIFNANGMPYLIEVDFDRFIDHKRNLYSTDWEFIEAECNYRNDKNHIIDKPKCLKEMLDLAAKLSEGIPQVRTDFYVIDDIIMFGELTFYHEAGFASFNPKELDEKMGGRISI